MGEERAMRRRGAGRAQVDAPRERGDTTPGTGREPAPGSHVPVMLEEIRELLTPALAGRQAVCVDATLGLGGHAEALLQDHPQLTLIGLDRDSQALERTRARLAPFADRVQLVHTGYRHIATVLDELGHPRVDGVLFDLGVSSLQLDLPERGFSYATDAPLDMRMDTSTGVPAETVVNEYSAGELARVLKVYGEERYASRIAAAIVRERSRKRLTSSRQLAAIVQDAIPVPARRTGGNPAKRTFQALRIEVNGELDELTEALPAAVAALRVGGRLAALAYHSLEDRIVKQTLGAGAQSSAPLGLPVEPPGTEPRLRLLTRGAMRPGDQEVAVNPRAASARLRAAERIREAT